MTKIITTAGLMVLVEWDRPSLNAGLPGSVSRKVNCLGKGLLLLLMHSESCNWQRKSKGRVAG